MYQLKRNCAKPWTMKMFNDYLISEISYKDIYNFSCLPIFPCPMLHIVLPALHELFPIIKKLLPLLTSVILWWRPIFWQMSHTWYPVFPSFTESCVSFIPVCPTLQADKLHFFQSCFTPALACLVSNVYHQPTYQSPKFFHLSSTFLPQVKSHKLVPDIQVNLLLSLNTLPTTVSWHAQLWRLMLGCFFFFINVYQNKLESTSYTQLDIDIYIYMIH